MMMAILSTRIVRAIHITQQVSWLTALTFVPMAKEEICQVSSMQMMDQRWLAIWAFRI